MPRPVDVVCAGEAMVQLTPADGGRLARASSMTVSVGGAEANVARSLAHLGRRVVWASRLGADPFGDLVFETLRAAGVDVSLVARLDGAPTGVYFKDRAPEGTVAHYYRAGSAASRLDASDAITWAEAVRPRVVIVGGVTALLSASARGCVEQIVIDRAFGDATVAFDVNMRAALADGRSPSMLLEMARASDIVFVGRDEAEALWGTATAEDVRTLIADPSILVVKDAAVEAIAFSAARRVAVAAPKVDVVEATGAGDAFAAGWLDAWLRDASLEECLVGGHRLASRVLVTTDDVPASTAASS